jgi:hypothetical protein
MHIRQTAKLAFDAGSTQPIDIIDFFEEQPPEV